MKTVFKFIAAIAFLGIAIYAVFQWQANQKAEEEVIYLAVAGPITDTRGIVMVRGVEMYLDKIGNTINGRRVEVLPFDDANSKDQSWLRANEIANDPKQPLIVLGHRGSDQSLSAGEVYKEKHIPAITASAPSPSVTLNNEWYFRVITENNLQGHFVARYAQDVLGYDTISVIYVDNDYGRTLGEAVLSEAKKIGLTIGYQNGYEDLEKEERLGKLPDIVAELQNVPDPGLIILAVSDEDGAHLVYNLHNADPNMPILEGLITQTFYNTLNDLSSNNSAPYLQNLWTTQHLIYDTGNIIAREFREDYIARYGEEPDAVAAAYYDATMMAAKAIEATNSTGSNPEKEREAIRSFLSKITKPNPEFRGATGFIYFDKNRSAIKPVRIGIYDQGTLVSAPIQMSTIPNPDIFRDLPDQILQGNIVRLDGNYYYKTQVIYTGIDLNEISNIDIKTSTFTADFYIWFRYNGEFDESKIEFVNAVSAVNLGTPIAEDNYNGQVYHAYRVKANFKSSLNFRAYPFDSQSLDITIRSRDIPYSQLIFVRDEVRSLEDATLKEHLNKSIIGGWEVVDVNLYSDIFRSESTLGNPRLNNVGLEYSVFHVNTIVKRDVINFSIKNLFPMFAVLALAYLAFFLPASEFGMRVSLGINALMTTAFFSLKVSSDLPPIGYIVALEYIFFMIYTLSLMIIMLAIMIYIADKRENSTLVTRLFWAGRILFPLLIVITAYLIVNIIQTSAIY